MTYGCNSAEHSRMTQQMRGWQIGAGNQAPGAKRIRHSHHTLARCMQGVNAYSLLGLVFPANPL
jgi:hypothetical protein